jgi:hypothetical protein
LEAERDHVLARSHDDAEEAEFARAQRERNTPEDPDAQPFQALAASAHFDRVLYDGGEFGTSAEEEDFLGLPGLLEPEQVASLLRERRAGEHGKRSRQASPAANGAPARNTAGGWQAAAAHPRLQATAAGRANRPHQIPGRRLITDLVATIATNPAAERPESMERGR